MKQIRFAEYDWLTRERWGKVHRDKPHWYYDDDQVRLEPETQDLILSLERKPINIPSPNGRVNSYIATGLVSCIEKFSYGYFEIEATLPTGPNLWPAFWMWGWLSWPPEIDVLEAYSNSRGSYFKPRLFNPLGFWNIQSNVHYDKYNVDGREETMNIGGKTHWFGFKNPANNSIKYSCYWDKDVIEIYYNGGMVRRITDSKILTPLRNHKMNVIINNGVQSKIRESIEQDKGESFGKKIEGSESDFRVKNFIYSPFNLNEY